MAARIRKSWSRRPKARRWPAGWVSTARSSGVSTTKIASGSKGWRRSGARRPVLRSENPATGETLGTAPVTTDAGYQAAVQAASAAFQRWRELPAPKRGEIVREFGEAFRREEDSFGRLVSQ